MSILPIEILMTEAEVIASLKQHLMMKGWEDREKIKEILVDAHHSNMNSSYAKKLEPMSHIWINNQRPDVVCLFEQSNQPVIGAFEVKKSSDDWQKGLGQARHYKDGVHYSVLAFPGRKGKKADGLIRQADELGVGVWVYESKNWEIILPARKPQPQPWIMVNVLETVQGIHTANRIQLNSPINYLLVPFFRLLYSDLDVGKCLIEMRELKEGVATHAFKGAVGLGLVDSSGQLRPKGRSLAELMIALGFKDTTGLPLKGSQQRLKHFHEGLGTLAKIMFLDLPVVRLLTSVLEGLTSPINTIELAGLMVQKDHSLTHNTLFQISDQTIRKDFVPEDFNPSFVFKLKQNLWHAGILRFKAHHSSGKKGSIYQPQDDFWQLE